jgi:glutathione S-transferase
MAALEEKGASWRLAPVVPGTMRSPEHLARHPFGRVPVLEHDGFSLYETQAILRYLDRTLPTPALSPSDARRLARMDQVMNINDWYLFHGVGNVIVFHRVVGPRVMGFWASRNFSQATRCRSPICWWRPPYPSSP